MEPGLYNDKKLIKTWKELEDLGIDVQKNHKLCSFLYEDESTEPGEILVKNKLSGTLILPEGIEQIGMYAFRDSDLTGIIFPKSLKIIRESAFYNCENLKNVTFLSDDTKLEEGVFAHTGIEKIVLPKNLKEIPPHTFHYCSNLKEIVFNEKLEIISDNAFRHCIKLANLYFPESLTEIAADVFEECDMLSKVFVPKNVKYLGIQHDQIKYSDWDKNIDIAVNFPFNECKNLKEINVSNENEYFTSEDGILFNKNKTSLIKYPEGKEKNTYVLSNTIKNIYLDAFLNNKINTIEFSEALEKSMDFEYFSVFILGSAEEGRTDFDKDDFQPFNNTKLVIPEKFKNKYELVFNEMKEVGIDFEIINLDYLLDKYGSFRKLNNEFKESINIDINK